MTHNKTMLILALAAGALSAPLGANAQQKLITAQSSIGFTTKQMGVPLDGQFKKFDAQINFDPSKPETSKIAFTVDTASATLGVPESDAELPKPTWFNVSKFPQAQFQSSSVKSLGAGKFQVKGKLTIKGNANEVDVPVALVQSNGVTSASGQFAIKRLTFKIGENEWADTSMVADEVQVKFKLSISGMGKL